MFGRNEENSIGRLYPVADGCIADAQRDDLQFVTRFQGTSVPVIASPTFAKLFPNPKRRGRVVVKRLTNGIDLVVILASRKCEQLCLKDGQPRRALSKVYLSGFKDCRGD